MDSGGRHILNDDDNKIIDDIKDKLSVAIKQLKDSGVRNANIELALMWHIKAELKGSEEY